MTRGNKRIITRQPEGELMKSAVTRTAAERCHIKTERNSKANVNLSLEDVRSGIFISLFDRFVAFKQIIATAPFESGPVSFCSCIKATQSSCSVLMRSIVPVSPCGSDSFRICWYRGRLHGSISSKAQCTSIVSTSIL